MDRIAELELEVQALQDRLTRLSAASFSINESLDYAEVLQIVVDCAVTLTNARYGIISTIHADGGIESFNTSGTSPSEHQRLVELPQGMRAFEFFSKISSPVRVTDYSAFAKTMGLPDEMPMQVKAGLAAPIRYQRENVGTLYVGHQSPDLVFSKEDEEILIMFASQASLVIANARRHREEQRARKDLETLVDTSPVGVAVIDAASGDPTMFNREVGRLLDSLRIDDQSFEEMLSEVTIRRADGRELSLGDLSVTEEVKSVDPVRAEEITFQAPDGRSVGALVNATPIRSGDGEVESVIVTLQDLAPLEEHERLRAEFLAMVSHELRTPLTSIKGSIANLLDPQARLDPAEVTQFHRIIDSQTDRMRDLISDLLDVALIETGALSVDPEATDLALLIDEARRAFQAGNTEQTLYIELPPTLPRVMADRGRTIQVITNLLSNAARSSPRGALITVNAETAGVYVEVSVTDDGRGIPADRLPRLFRKFSRIEAEEQGGDTGLGLAICRGIVEAHGGRIWVESDGPGLGARFVFTVPIADTPSPALSPLAELLQPDSVSPVEREPIRILAVDDDPETLRYIRSALSNAGYQATVTGDPLEAQQIAAQGQLDAILLDLVLPETDGIELMQEMLKTVDVPVIFLSAYGQEDVIARAFDTGADDYIVKPFSPTELAARIRAALRRRHLLKAPPEPYIFSDLQVDFVQRRVVLRGQRVRLTPIEFRLLVELALTPGDVVSHEQLLKRVWHTDAHGDMRPVRTAVKSLRRKLGDNAEDPIYIFTEPRIGYRIARPGDPPSVDPLR